MQFSSGKRIIVDKHIYQNQNVSTYQKIMPETNLNDELLHILINEVKTLRQELSGHMTKEEDEIKDLSKKVTDLTDIWKTTKGIIWFIKWSSAVIAGIALTWAFLTDHFHIGVK